MTQPWKSLPTLVTGASAGLGAEFARELARRQCPLAITARRLDRLESLRLELQKLGAPRVEVIVADLKEPGAAHGLKRTLESLNFIPAGLVNNAGLGYYKFFADSPLSKVREMVDVNITALLELTHELLPLIKTHPRGLVLNVSSIASFVPLPHLATYSASKAFVTNFSAALSRELQGSNILVHTLCPGPTESEFMQVAANDPSVSAPGRMTAEVVIKGCLCAIDKGRRLYISGRKNYVLSLIPRILPLWVVSWLALHAKGARPSARD
ncbi:MAG: SDR family NAD(P)-dependent oxidoreductase [Planctomycetota bacterium]